jgi:hypothetical protein
MCVGSRLSMCACIFERAPTIVSGCTQDSKALECRVRDAGKEERGGKREGAGQWDAVLRAGGRAKCSHDLSQVF